MKLVNTKSLGINATLIRDKDSNITYLTIKFKKGRILMQAQLIPYKSVVIKLNLDKDA